MLLANAGLSFEPVPADIDERGLQQASRLSALGEIAGLLAREKARALSPRGRPDIMSSAPIRRWRWASGYSTNPMAAPRGGRAASRAFQGGPTNCIPAIAVVLDGKVAFETVTVARMSMRRLGGDEIRLYLDEAGEAVTTSVGAYQLEGLGVHLFERIEGDHFTILGLPLLPLLAFLRHERLIGL